MTTCSSAERDWAIQHRHEKKKEKKNPTDDNKLQVIKKKTSGAWEPVHIKLPKGCVVSSNFFLDFFLPTLREEKCMNRGAKDKDEEEKDEKKVVWHCMHRGRWMG